MTQLSDHFKVVFCYVSYYYDFGQPFRAEHGDHELMVSNSAVGIASPSFDIICILGQISYCI